MVARASCHPAEHAEWRGSRHAAAWVDPVFQAEFARGRPAWCVGCHAPAALDPLAVDDADPRVARGVGCEGCHRRGGLMVSARVAARSPHDTIADPEFGGADFTARSSPPSCRAARDRSAAPLAVACLATACYA